jgi:hypothetical protein
MNRQSFAAALIALTLCTSCQTLLPRSAAVETYGDTVLWKREQVEDLEVTLLDSDGHQHLCFNKGGILTVSGGAGGMVTGGVCGWRLRQGRLFTCDTEGEALSEEFYLVSLTDELLTVRRTGGELERYKVHPRRSS